jgi:hypothetical protein
MVNLPPPQYSATSPGPSYQPPPQYSAPPQTYASYTSPSGRTYELTTGCSNHWIAISVLILLLCCTCCLLLFVYNKLADNKKFNVNRLVPTIPTIPNQVTLTAPSLQVSRDKDGNVV